MIPGITVKLPTQRHVPRPHTVRIPNNMAKSWPHRVTFICPLSPIQFASCWYPYHSLLIECLCGRGGDAVLSTLCEVFPPTRGLCLGALQGVGRGSVRCASCSDSATSPPRLNPGPSSSSHTCGSPINCTADYTILCLPPGEPTQTPPPFFITSFHLLELKNHQMETFI